MTEAKILIIKSKEASFRNDRKMVLSEIAERRFFLKQETIFCKRDL